MKIVFIRNGVVGGGLEIMSELQANYFYSKGFDVTLILDNSYSQKLLDSKNVKVYNKGIKIIPALTSKNYLSKAPQVKRKTERQSWFGGTISYYYDEYSVLVKTAWHDSNKQRVKISIPVMEEYLATLNAGDIVITMEPSFSWYIGNLELPKGVSSMSQMHNQHFFLEDWIDNIEKHTTLVCLTPKTKEVYEEIYGKKENISIVPNPLRNVIPKEIQPHSERPLKIVSVGRLEDVKQPYDILKSFAKINKSYPDSTLEFYGTGALTNELKAFVKESGFIDKVFFKGYESNLEKIFSDASLMLLTSKRESFGLVIIEAFSYGVPVVAYTTTFGVDDLIEDSKDGYIVEQGNVNDLTEKAIELLENMEVRNSFGIYGYKKIIDYEYEKVMVQWLRLVKDISSVEINDKLLQYNLIERMLLPKAMLEHILYFDYSNTDLDEIINTLLKAEAKVLNGKAYIYSKELIEKYSFPLNCCEVF